MNLGSPQESDHGNDGERICQGNATGERPCNMAGTVHCVKCEGWFCDAHAEDQLWHPCMRDMA